MNGCRCLKRSGFLSLAIVGGLGWGADLWAQADSQSIAPDQQIRAITPTRSAGPGPQYVEGRRVVLGGACPATSCVGTDCTVTQSLDTMTIEDTNTIACGSGGNTTPNGWARCFDLCEEGINFGGSLVVNSVTFGVQEADIDGINVNVKLYQDADGCPPMAPGADGALLSTKSLVVNMADIGTFINVDFTDLPLAERTIPAGRDLIVEVEQVDDGTVAPLFGFRPAGNSLGQCTVNYLRAMDCAPGTDTWEDINVDFPDAHLILVVDATQPAESEVCGDSVIEGCEECDPPDPEMLCDDNCQNIVIGACCNFDGAGGCQEDTPEADCNAAGGNWLGAGAACFLCACDPDSGPCDQPTPGIPGCEDFECCSTVCNADDFCCVVEWDESCASNTEPGGLCFVPECGAAGTGDCFMANGTTFCEDLCDGQPCSGCCDSICSFDPFCCDTEWDAICADEATQSCLACGPKDQPENDDCVNAIPVGTGTIPVSNICASIECFIDPECDDPDYADCNDTFAVGLGFDIWYEFTPDFTGTLSILLDLEGTWSPQLAIHEGCDCGAISDPPLACVSEMSNLTAPVTAGTCYLIRLGSSVNGLSGSGTMNISAVPESCIGGVGDCLQANGSVGCDELTCCAVVCGTNPECCSDTWTQACAEVAAAACSPLPCGETDMSEANFVEPEACGDDLNGGCNATPPAFTDITSGTVVAGTSWADAGMRDTDWYRIQVTSGDDVDGDGLVDVHFGVAADLGIVSFLIDDVNGDCSETLTIGTNGYGQSCACGSSGVATVDAPGEYYIFAGTGTPDGGAVFEGFPCDGPEFGSNYLLSVVVADDEVNIGNNCPLPAPPCPWDCSDDAGQPDGQVGIQDLLDLLAQWGGAGGCDLDGGGVGITDLLELLANWGPCV